MTNSSNSVAKSLFTIGIVVMLVGALAGLIVGAQISVGGAILFGLSAASSGIPFIALAEILNLLQIGVGVNQQCNYKLDQLIALEQAILSAQQTAQQNAQQPCDEPPAVLGNSEELLQTLRSLPNGKEIRAALEANRSMFEEKTYQEILTEVDRLISLGRLYGDMKQDILAYLSKTVS